MNPLTRLSFYILFSISVLLSDGISIIAAHILLIFLLLIIKRQLWKEWKRHTRPYWIYFPLSGIIFFIISVFISQRQLDVILFDVTLATLRLSATVSIMTLYIIDSRSQDTLSAIRGLLFSSGIKYQWIDNLLLYFEITIRFFPSVKEQWYFTERSQRALAIKKSKSRFNRIINIAKSIPDFIIINLQKTDNIVQNMLMRGYGINSSRSVYPHIKFKSHDCIISSIMLGLVIGVHIFV